MSGQGAYTLVFMKRTMWTPLYVADPLGMVWGDYFPNVMITITIIVLCHDYDYNYDYTTKLQITIKLQLVIVI